MQKGSLKLLFQVWLAGWSIVAVFWAVLIIYMAMVGRPFPEVGFLGSYILFGTISSGFFLVNFLVITVPLYFYSASWLSGLDNKLAFLFGGLLYVISEPIWNSLIGWSTLRETLIYLSLALLSGGITTCILVKKIKIRH